METVISRKYCLNLLHILHSSIPRSWTSHIYYYFQNIKKKIGQLTLGPLICENIQCSHSSQLVDHWLVSKLWKETSKFSLCQQTQLLPECSPCPHQPFFNRKSNNQLFYCYSCQQYQWHKKFTFKSLLHSNNNKKNKRESPMTQLSSQCQCYYSENRSHGAAITINMSPFHWQMFLLNKHNQDLGRFTLAAAEMDEYSLISLCPS